MYVRLGSIVTALQSKPLRITASCFQYHKYGRRTGLKIRSCAGGIDQRTILPRAEVPLELIVNKIGTAGQTQTKDFAEP